MNELGTRIRELRKAAGWTLRDLAERADIAHSTLTKIETGKIENPTMDTLQGIARALNVNLFDLGGEVKVETTREMGVKDLRMVLANIPELTETEAKWLAVSIGSMVKRRQTPEGQAELEMLRRLEEEAKRPLTPEDVEYETQLQSGEFDDAEED